jgi:putative transposase
MPRTARSTPPGYAYHITNRGVGGMRLFSGTADYVAFEKVFEETAAIVRLRICSYCVMPNHWHFLVWPQQVDEVAEFFQRLTVTHAMRWQKFHDRVGLGHVYQGRFKSFPIDRDDHFYSVARYIERNPLRANLVKSALDWRWSSLWSREFAMASKRALLSEWPVLQPGDWLKWINEPQTEAELTALRKCLQRGAPYGNANWVQATAKNLGLESTLRPRGRPKKGTGPFSRSQSVVEENP